MSNSHDKTRTVTLTDRPPVQIREADWPTVAVGRYDDHDGKVRVQADRTWRAAMRVRQHADGRALVYGVYDYDTAHPRERGFEARAGVLLDPGLDLVAAIRDVGTTLTSAAEESEHDFGAHISEAVRQCIADLPAGTL